MLANWSKTTVDHGLLTEKKTMVGVVVKKDHGPNGHLPKKTGPTGLFEKKMGDFYL